MNCIVDSTAGISILVMKGAENNNNMMNKNILAFLCLLNQFIICRSPDISHQLLMKYD